MIGNDNTKNEHYLLSDTKILIPGKPTKRPKVTPCPPTQNPKLPFQFFFKKNLIRTYFNMNDQ